MRSSNSPLEPVFRFFSRHRQVVRIFILILLFLALLACWRIGRSTIKKTAGYENGKVPISEADFETYFSSLHITELDRETQSSDAKELFFDSAQETVNITEGGNYILSGKLYGAVHIDVYEDTVHLILNGVEITSKSGPAVYCRSAEKLVITLEEGTENTISDSSDYRAYPEAEACIYSEADLTLNGKGSLAVNSYYKDGIRSKDILKILDGDYQIKCKRTALRGNDGILAENGTFMISAEKYGFMTTKSGENGRGALILSGGDYSIIAGRYAFVATKANLYIYHCTVNHRSIVAPYDVGGTANVERGVLDE